MNQDKRIHHTGLQRKICNADDAAQWIKHGDLVGVSGFTGAGYPKAVPGALADRIKQAHDKGEEFQIKVLTGASTGPQMDGVLAEVNGVSYRSSFNTDPKMRARINKGDTTYFDMHLGQVASFYRSGAVGDMDVAIIELSSIREDGTLIASSAVGNNQLWLNSAKKVILEVNYWQPAALDGMHDIWEVTKTYPQSMVPIQSPSDRIGTEYMTVDLDKVVAIVQTNDHDRNTPFTPPDENAQMIAGHLMDFLKNEIKKGRIPEGFLPLQSGVGNVANAVMDALSKEDFENLTAYTEVIQDGMLAMLESGKMRFASSTSFSLSPEKVYYFNNNIEKFRDKIIFRPQELSNHPEVIRRLGCIAMNAAIEIDIFGNVNSTHIMGTRMMSGIGGSGDFARNAYLTIFMTPSLAKDGAISAIVPMVSRVDHASMDIHIVVTEYGLADLRGLAPRQRAELLIEKCAHPTFRPLLREYYKKGLDNGSIFTPHYLKEALSWHERFVTTGSMLP